ncbi:MAG: tRNA threonylcarbamoyladenosine dehydratase [Acutalibacteraceae bacterium]|nr:tRNA threonylcarbamoyladenosine dehydratase [Acutalibacteraceae bacterium]
MYKYNQGGENLEHSQFLRSEMILGEKSTEILKNKSVILFGLGGVGSYTAEALARAGIGRLTIVDNDTVSVTNLNRQLCALHSTVGMPKVDVVKARILDINPQCEVTAVRKFYLPENSDEFNLESFDYIADAIDTVSAKIDLAVKSQTLGIPLIACMGTGNKLDPSRFTVSDIFKTSGCPLCRVMRNELKKRGIKKLNVVWSPEEPVKPLQTDENSGKRQTPASLPFVPPVAGMIMAGKIITDLAR